MSIIKNAILAAALVVAGTAGASAADYEFKLHHFLGEKAPAHSKMLLPWAKQVEENSGGKVAIQLYPAMTLGGRPPELISQVRDGVVDLVWTVNGYTPGLFPRTEVFELPGIHTNDTKATNLALMDLYESDLKEEYKGVEVMFLHVHAGQGIHMRDTEVRSPADLEGKKIRIPTRTGAWVIEALGAAPVAMPVPELPTALQKGVIDGAFIPWEIIPPLKIQEQTEYQIEGADKERFGTTTFQVSMNKDRWDSLPEDVQKAFRDASGPEWVAKVGELWAGTDDFGIGLATKAGNTHVTLSEEETEAFRKALAPVTDRWVEEVAAKGIDGAALVEKARAAVASNTSN
jgi:TRAP-type C4-dicarboxylate transport system substrate-binding protein